MDVKDLFVEIGMKEDDITAILFGKKAVELTEDAFDNSKEGCIFEELLCRTDSNSVSSHHLHLDRGGKTTSGKELISASTPSSSTSGCKSVRRRIVESFAYGNLASYLVFCHNINHQMQKTVAFPDVASTPALMVQWMPPSIERVCTGRAVARRNQRAKLCSVLDLEKVEITGARLRLHRDGGQRKDGYSHHAVLWNHLRLHAHLLMMDAGWKILGRERGDKSKVDKVYEAPDKAMRLFSLPRAWKCFGQWLLMNSSGFGGNDYGRVWFNIHDFLSDLKNTMLCLEHEVRLPKQSLSFLNQWQLLDPFMAVVCIDKKVAALRNGVALKAVNSTVMFVSHTESKLLSIRNAGNPLGLDHSNNYNSAHPRSRKNLLPLLQSDDHDGNSPHSKQPCTFGTSKSSQYKMDQRLLSMEAINERGIRGTSHRIVMGLRDSTALSGSMSTCLNVKNKLPHSKSNLAQGIQDKSDPLYFPPSYSSDYLVENVQIKDPTCHAYDLMETANVDGPADSPNELLLSAEFLFSHEMDEMLLGTLDGISKEQQFTVAVSESQEENIDAGDRPSGPSSRLSEKDRDSKVNKNDINNKQHDAAVVPESQLANKDVKDGHVGALPLLPQKDAVMEANETSLEEVTKTGLLSYAATDSVLVIAEPQLLFVSPEDGTLSFMNDSVYGQEIQNCLSASNATMGTNMQLNIHSSVYEASLIQGFLYLDSEGSPICWTVINPEPPRQLVCSSGSQPTSKESELHGEMNMESEPLTSEPKQMPAFDSSKNSRKRSKKVADIENKASRKKQKVNGVPVSYCAIGQHMECTTKNPAVRLICNDEEQIGAANIEQISLNLLPRNNSDKNEGTGKQVPVNNNNNDQDGVSIGSTEMIVPEKPPKRQQISLNLLPGNNSDKNEGTEKQVPVNNNKNDQDGVSIGSPEMIVPEKPPKRPQISLKLLPGNNSDKNEGTGKQVPVNNNNNDQDGVSIGSTEMIVPEKPPKRQQISLNLLPRNNSDKNEGTEKQVRVNNKNDPDVVSIGSTEMIVREKPPKRQQIPLNLLSGNNSGKNEGAEKKVPINNNNNDQDGVSIGSTEMIVPEKPPKRQKTPLLHKCKFDDSDLLVTAAIHRLTASYRNRFSRRLAKKVGFKRLPRCRWENEEKYVRKKFPKGARTVLGKLLEMGIVCKENILQYRRPGSKSVLKDGNITKMGIRCRCCDTMFTMSGFKCHAGLQQEILPLNLFLGSGEPYTLCQLQAWSIEHETRKEHAKDPTPLQADQNDDTCGLCGDGGELICCDNCPASYHQDCLPCQDIPDGSWYCYGCLCDICGEVINLKELGSSLPALECSQCKQQYHVKCISGKLLCNEEGETRAWFCGRKCQQIYMNLRYRVGMPDHINDGFSCTILRNNGDQKISKDADIALLAECNMKLVIALSIMEECFLPIIDPRTGIDIIPPILYNWRSDFVHLDYKGFYTVVLENDDNIISVASIRLHGTLVAEMPLVATCRENCQQGMCKRLMDYIEEMLKSLKVEMLLLSAIPNLVDTWTSTFGFELIDDRDKKKLSKLRLVSVPGTALLKRNLSDCSDADAGQLSFPKP